MRTVHAAVLVKTGKELRPETPSGVPFSLE
jgi:hypothetical protein